MISKRLAFFLVILTAGGVYASYAIDRARDVPRFPPGIAQTLGSGAPGAVVPRVPAAKPNGNAPDKLISDLPEPGTAPVEPNLPSEGDAVRIETVELQGIEVGATERVIDPGDNSFVVVTIKKDGNVYWGSLDTGSIEMLGTMMERNAETAGFRVVVAPDKNAPWKYVQWTLATARAKGVTNIRLGGYPDTDKKGTLLAALRADVAAGSVEGEIPEGMEEIVVTVAMDDEGNAAYTVAGEDVEGAPGVNTAASPWNSEYATFWGVDYSRKATTSPWVIRPGADVPAGKVLRAMAALRLAAVYGFRVDGDYGDPPGK